MKSSFKEVSPDLLCDNVFKLIGEGWMLITAGTLDSFNMMTASWGGFGVLWGKSICFCVIRPSRYTYGFMENSDFFTLAFFEEEYRKVLKFCGTNSGRNVDKVAKTGLTPLRGNTGTIYFNEARLVIECKKIYFQDVDPEHFLESDIKENYPEDDYHRMYVGEIIKCLEKKSGAFSL